MKPRSEVSLFKRAFTGGMWMAGINYVTFALMFAGQILLVRLLVPEDFGIFALALSISEMIFIFGGFSISMSCIALQEEPDVLDTGMFLSFILAVIMAVLSIAVSMLANFYYSKQTVVFLLILCLIKIFQLPTSIYSASLEKDFLFKRNSLITSIAKSSGLIIALALALIGFGAWSLLAREVLMIVFLFVGMISFSNYKFSFRFNQVTAVKIWRYSYRMFFMRMGEVAFHRLPSFIIGTLSGVNILGLYDRSIYLARLPNAMLAPFTSNVSFSLYSKVKDDHKKISEGLYWSLLFILRITFPIGLLTLFFPETIIKTLFGMYWVEAAPFIRGFSLFLIFIPLFEVLRHFLLAKGFIKETTTAYILSIVFLIIGIIVCYYLDKWFLVSWFISIGIIVSFVWLAWNVQKIGIKIAWLKITGVPVILSIGIFYLALHLNSINIDQLLSIVIILLVWLVSVVAFEYKLIFTFYDRVRMRK